ncbi:MAG: fumarylacetoacetate hydrolase family protein, partial [Alicyclobacillus herbarius]|uniref:fumarylacetoacetate hydrolase family protein n=1 Tax=Alicyclobacillus herbarius TaxID=122960 RepID=UPI002352606D
MKIAIFADSRLGVVEGDIIYDVGSAVGWDREQPQRSLTRLISDFGAVREAIVEALPAAPRYLLAEKALRPPVPTPSKMVTAPVNYISHKQEMNQELTVRRLGVFLKAPSSIIGPGDTIRLPFSDRRTDHEAELAFVVGRMAKDVPAEQAADYIFGYLGLMDITVRGPEERPMRKSYDTFTPIGPWLV